MSTRIFITGLEELRRKAQQAQDANRQAALERQARDVELQVFPQPPTSPINELVRPLRSLLKGARPTAQRESEKRRIGALFELGNCTFSSIEYLYNTDGSPVGLPVRGLTRRAMKISVGAVYNPTPVQLDIYDHPYFNPDNTSGGAWTETTGNPNGSDGFEGGPEANGTVIDYYAVDDADGFVVYFAIPIGNNSCFLCAGTRCLTTTILQSYTRTYANSAVYTVPGPASVYDRNELFTTAYAHDNTQTYTYHCWLVTPTSITEQTLPVGVQDVLKAELGDGILTRNFVGYDFSRPRGYDFVDTRSDWVSSSEWNSGYQSAGPMQYPETWNWAGTPDVPLFQKDYAGLTNLGLFPDEYPSSPSCWAAGPGVAVAIQENEAARTWLTAADRTPAEIVSAYFSGDPVPSQSYVIDYSNSLGTSGLVYRRPLGRLDYDIDNVSGGELGDEEIQGGFAAPEWEDMPPNYLSVGDIRRRIVYWDWGQRAYCRSNAAALGFTLP